jgi:hypothetical protein
VIANRTSQYRVGVFSNHCFFAYFLTKVACAFCLKNKRKKFGISNQKVMIFVQPGHPGWLGLELSSADSQRSTLTPNRVEAMPVCMMEV